MAPGRAHSLPASGDVLRGIRGVVLAAGHVQMTLLVDGDGPAAHLAVPGVEDEVLALEEGGLLVAGGVGPVDPQPGDARRVVSHPVLDLRIIDRQLRHRGFEILVGYGLHRVERLARAQSVDVAIVLGDGGVGPIIAAVTSIVPVWIPLRDEAVVVLFQRQGAVHVQRGHVVPGCHQRPHFVQVRQRQVERIEDGPGQGGPEHIARTLILPVDVQQGPHEGVAQQVLDPGQVSALSGHDVFELSDQRGHGGLGDDPRPGQSEDGFDALPAGHVLVLQRLDQRRHRFLSDLVGIDDICLVGYGARLLSRPGRLVQARDLLR